MGNRVIYRADVNLDNEPKTAAAYQALLPRYMELGAAELIAVNADITTVVATMSAAASRLGELRDQIRSVGVSDPDMLDEIGPCADGLDYAEGQYRAELQSTGELADLARECGETREMFMVDLRNAAAHGVIDSGYLSEYSGAPGFKNTIDDVRLLTRLYRNHWPALSGRTCRTLEELDRAEAVIHRMALLGGERGQRTTGSSEVAEMRTRAFTYAVKRYDAVRRVVQFVRWNEGDADSLAPSLWRRRGGKRKPETEPEQPAPQPQIQLQNQPQPAIGPLGPFVDASTTPAAGANGTQVRLAGMPGGSPFIQ